MAKKKGAAPEETENTAAAENSQTAEQSAQPQAADAPKTAEEKKEPSTEELLAAEKDKYLRLMAEYDNFRKRTQKEREALYNDVLCTTVLKILPVYDNLARALKQETADAAFKRGVEMTMQQLEEIFKKLGVTEIPAVGEKFDPALHNAVMHIEDENYGDNEIVDEFEKGFRLGDKVIRFSMVRVAN